jgi:hypothetical protein
MASDKGIVSFAGGIVGDPDKTAALIIRRIQSDRLNIRDDHVLCPIYELHHDMINDLYRNGHVVHGLFADCLAVANSKTEGQAYTNKWQEIADNIRK